MLLPHGYDGAGPEHSSSRVERLLQMTDSYEEGVDPDNINFQVCISKSFQSFSCFFRFCGHQPPLNTFTSCVVKWSATIVNQAPSLCRKRCCDFQVRFNFGNTYLKHYPGALSTMADLAPGTYFQSVIDDPSSPKSVEKVIFTCGRHYYTLLDERKKRNLVDKVALIRIEELCPFPSALIGQIASKYPSAGSFMFAQEEPRNCGAYSFARPRLEFALGRRVAYAGRPELPTSATGNGIHHKQQISDMLQAAFE